eukprot:CAMPEP_0172684260 /NCGR_PEP_ID=MMETSP1074-20121228/19433_1 /TAXON_ID=2916 /ORGANISM="Ceratium fusus, Strain PA161109" /LENGTH=61 /DNA_ID=CAMNT_0013503245 /DNA_START=565 /DNA_END=750 /DNA_ORIENTATION=-
MFVIELTLENSVALGHHNASCLPSAEPRHEHFLDMKPVDGGARRFFCGMACAQSQPDANTV